VGSRHFHNKARRSFWSIHVQAWHQSGLTRTAYRREHRLNKCTFDRWLKVLNTLELQKIRQRTLRTDAPADRGEAQT
jgi:hypothetical protein